jgi:hypothetical protein
MSRLRHDVGWAPAKPRQENLSSQPEKLTEAPPIASATAPGPDVANKNKNSLMLLILVSAFCEDQTRRQEAGTGGEHLINNRHETEQEQRLDRGK